MSSMNMNMHNSPFDRMDTQSPSQPQAKIFTRRKQGQATNGRRPGQSALVLDAETISTFFGVSQRQACEVLGIGLSTMKRMCRKLGIMSWPGPGNSTSKSPVNAAPLPHPPHPFPQHMGFAMPVQQFAPHHSVSFPHMSTPMMHAAAAPPAAPAHHCHQEAYDNTSSSDKQQSRACELEIFGFRLPSVDAPALADFASELNQAEAAPAHRPQADASSSFNQQHFCSEEDFYSTASSPSSSESEYDDDELFSFSTFSPSPETDIKQPSSSSSSAISVDEALRVLNAASLSSAPPPSEDFFPLSRNDADACFASSSSSSFLFPSAFCSSAPGTPKGAFNPMDAFLLDIDSSGAVQCALPTSTSSELW